MHFSDRLAAVIKAKNSCLMLGLDPNFEKIPKKLFSQKESKKSFEQNLIDVYEKFSCDMVNVCAEKVCGIKIQMAYFEAWGSIGVKAVENIIAYVRKNYPDLIIMMDAKRGDIGSTSRAYAQAFLGKDSPLAGDCVTVAPYMGADTLSSFEAMAYVENKGVFILAKTSNPSSADIQDVKLNKNTTVATKWAKQVEGFEVAFREHKEEIVKRNNKYSLFGLVVGATHPEDLVRFRKIAPTTWILAPGVGAQGGKIEDVLAIRDEDGLGVLIPVSRSVLYASDGEDYLKAAQAEIESLWAAQKL